MTHLQFETLTLITDTTILHVKYYKAEDFFVCLFRVILETTRPISKNMLIGISPGLYHCAMPHRG